jgi:hypothetical protein
MSIHPAHTLRNDSQIEEVILKPSYLDENWDVLTAEYHARGRRIPWLDLLLYRALRCWMQWRTKRACQ